MEDSNLEGLGSLVRLSGVSVPARARLVGEALLGSIVNSITLGLSFGMVGSMTPLGPLLPFFVGSWTGYTLGLIQHWRSSCRLTLYYATCYPTLLAHAMTCDRYMDVPPEVVRASEEQLVALTAVASSSSQSGDTIGKQFDDDDDDDDDDKAAPPQHSNSSHLQLHQVAFRVNTSAKAAAAGGGNHGESDEENNPPIPTLEQWILAGGIGRMTWSIIAAQSCRPDVEELNRQLRQKLMDDYAERYG